MDRLEGMTILLAAVDTGSLSAASRQLRLPLATVSRRVSELEEHLKIRLLLRGRRTVTLTDAGRAYAASCRRIMEDIAEAERAAAGEYLTPRGELTISVPQVLGRLHVMPVVAEFLRAYPDIRMHVQLDDRNVNLLEDDVDLALRIGELPDSSLIATRVASIRQVLCASPDYLKVRGVPKTPADLSAHDCIAYGELVLGSNWDFLLTGTRQIIPIPSRLVVNSVEAAVSAATAGAGIARVLSYPIDDLVGSGALVILVEEYEPSPIPVSFIYPSQRQVPLKLRAFLDFSIPRLRDRLGAQPR
ncbi:LysR family transcriptional regulator [Inquilinus limosus]|uniref:LysR family transcriptional regulator n=1 Tax=Inquilinus limosus TaxID=171674 RepID=UPI003F175E38